MSDSEPRDTGLSCPRCGYNLTALTSNVCPECGASFLVTDSEGRPPTPPVSRISQALQAASAVGAFLVIMSWFDVVPNVVGWAGFWLSVAAYLAQLALRR